MMGSQHTPGPEGAPRGGERTVVGDGPRLPGTDERQLQFGLRVVVASVLWGLATFLLMNGMTPFVPTNNLVGLMVAVNLILIGTMIAIIWVQVRGLVNAWKDRVAGARLHARVVGLFAVIAMLPAILLASGATITFIRALDSVFSQQTRSIIENSMEVAKLYLEEHGLVIRNDVVNMAKDLDDAAKAVGTDPAKFRQLVFSQAALRDLPVAYVIDEKAQVQVAAIENDRIPYRPPPLALLGAADRGESPILLPSDQYQPVMALRKLENYPGRYLFVARGVSPKALRHLGRAQQGVADFEQLRNVRSKLKFTYGLMYFMIALTALSSAIWAGLWFAGRLVAPIRRLITAAQEVTHGNLRVTLPIYRGEGDLRRLSENFNDMTHQLDRQRTELVTANDQLSERRQFIEAVLTGVSAGVIGLDAGGRVTIANRSAQRLLGREETDLVGRRLVEAVPEFAEVLQQNDAQRLKKPQTEVVIEVAGDSRTFATRLIREFDGKTSITTGSVLTFDDVTDLAVAQRTSAWAEIARRLAHEIKNPLTPIQLSAERLKRKYGKVVQPDHEVFDKCTDTIIRQVGDVARMVDEFSSFARMPKAEIAEMDAREALKDPVTLFQMASNGGYTIAVDMPQAPLMLMGDVRLLSQALTNLIKNATESVQSVAESKDKPEGFKGRVDVSLQREGETAVFEITDNGLGLPKQNRARLLEPYVTTKGNKGTGLGLAIVQKIAESHGGTLILEDAPATPERPRGARVRITLPLPSASAARVDSANENPPPTVAARKAASGGAA